MAASAVTEHRQLETQLAQVCRELGRWCWINSGTAIMQRGTGMADSLILGRKNLMFVELKSRDGRRTMAQVTFAAMVQMLGADYRLYRQQQFDDGTVRKDLAEL